MSSFRTLGRTYQIARTALGQIAVTATHGAKQICAKLKRRCAAPPATARDLTPQRFPDEFAFTDATQLGRGFEIGLQVGG